MKLFRAAITSAVFVAIGTLSRADPAPTIHYAPAKNLEHIDVELIDTAKREIDFAAYVLTDWPVIEALTRAANRGVKVRIYLDATQLAEREQTNVFRELAATQGIEIRTKHSHSAPMHLKSYEIDGRVLRTGAANFSASGLKRQDNDLIIIDDVIAAIKFKRTFETRFASVFALSPLSPFRVRLTHPAAFLAATACAAAPRMPYSQALAICQERAASIMANSRGALFGHGHHGLAEFGWVSSEARKRRRQRVSARGTHSGTLGSRYH